MKNYVIKKNGKYWHGNSDIAWGELVEGVYLHHTDTLMLEEGEELIEVERKVIFTEIVVVSKSRSRKKR